MIRQQCGRISSLLLEVNIFLCTVHGLLPYKYNASRRNFEPSRWISCYSLLINVLMIVGLCLTIPYELRSLEVRFMREKSLNGIIYALHKALSIVTLLGTSCCNWLGRLEVLRNLNAYAELEQEYFVEGRPHTSPNHDNRFFRNYLFGRSLMTFLQIASTFYARFGINLHPSVEYTIITVLSTLTKNVLLFSGSSFYIGLLSVCHYLQLLNADLLELVKRRAAEGQKNADGDFTLALDRSHRFYVRLCALAKRIAAMYQWQILLQLFSMCFGNIMASFYFLVYLGGKVVPFDRFTITLFPQVFLINLADIYLYMAVCERIQNVVNNSLLSLRHLNEAEIINSSAAKSVEVFALQSSSFKIRIRLAGIVDLNHKAAFQLVVATVLYVVLLVQFDYKNL